MSCYNNIMFDSVIFDMDGTILNTLTDLHISTNYALSSMGFPTRTIDEVKRFVGNGVELLIRRALPENSDEKTVKECMKTFKFHYAQNMYNNTVPYDGILDMLKLLKNKACPLTSTLSRRANMGYVKTAVVSNKFDLAVKELTRRYFDGLFDLSVGQSDDIPPKPNPKGVLKCIEEFQSKSPIYVGDSDVDIQTAKNAGIPVIGVTWGFRDRSYLKGADYIIDKPNELINILSS